MCTGSVHIFMYVWWWGWRYASPHSLMTNIYVEFYVHALCDQQHIRLRTFLWHCIHIVQTSSQLIDSSTELIYYYCCCWLLLKTFFFVPKPIVWWSARSRKNLYLLCEKKNVCRHYTVHTRLKWKISIVTMRNQTVFDHSTVNFRMVRRLELFPIQNSCRWYIIIIEEVPTSSSNGWDTEINELNCFTFPLKK